MSPTPTDTAGEEEGEEKEQQQQQEEPKPKESAASSARAKAEARRRRILQSKGERLGIVSGDVVPTLSTEEGRRETEVGGSTGGDDNEEEEEEENEGGKGQGDGGDTRTTTAAAADDQTGSIGGGGGGASSSSGTSRLQAMRRRRFKKASAAAAASEKKEEDDNAVKEGASPSLEENQNSPPVADKAEEDDAADVSTSEEVDKAEEEEGISSSGTSEKKYLGVAKMRRKKIAEQRKLEEEKSKSGGEGDVFGGGTLRTPSGRKVIPPSLSTVAKTAVKKHRMPIIMHLFVAVMLFVAGLDIGLQHSIGLHSTSYPPADVKMGISPWVDGPGILRLLEPLGIKVGGVTRDAAADAADAKNRLLLDQQVEGGWDAGGVETDEDDEFAEHGGSGDDDGTKNPRGVGGEESSEHVPNIDPIFQVDLDELTKGPGIFMTLARFAVSAHRCLLAIFLYFPLSVLKTILFLPRSLMASPPIIFLLSVSIRIFGRYILGAKIPDLDPSDVGGGGDEKKSAEDILDMIKQRVKDFVASSFPTAVMIFTVFRDAWTDMYVVICGLLVGLALPLCLPSGVLGVDSRANEEL